MTSSVRVGVSVKGMPVEVTHGMTAGDQVVLREGIARILAVVHLYPTITNVHFDVVASIPQDISVEDTN